MDANIAVSSAPHAAAFLAALGPLFDKATHVVQSPLMTKLVTWGVTLLGGGGAMKWLKNRAVEKYAHIVFMAVEEAARRDSGTDTTLDKAAMFATEFEAMMKRCGWWMLTEDDVQHAKVIADSLNLAYENAKAYAAMDVPGANPPTPDADHAAGQP